MATALHESWTHKLARALVRPLVPTAVTPNHLTTARLVTGLAACVAFAVGPGSAQWWAGGFWLLSAFLDRADGELARLSGKSSPGGHAYDYATDVVINSLVFIAIGFGLSGEAWGRLPLLLSLIAGIAIGGASILSEYLERSGKVDGKAYEGNAGFDFDDILYVLTPAAWLNWTWPLVIGAAIGGPFFLFITWQRLRATRNN
ncbi:MAG: CDP-alcohol phosphatidyltransferase family protein [Gammaproteobacteria bacterium]|nr:CDP-alcohol phosphatidyltransferase family protein [Gammaproteobacteria bacterium]